MVNEIKVDTGHWQIERNGKLHLKQNQLFHLHRLSLMLIKQTGRRVRFQTPDDLIELLTLAMATPNQAIEKQLNEVRKVLPFS